MLLVIEKQNISGVMDLNSVACVLISLLDEFRSLHPRTSSRFGSLANPLPPFRAVSCRGASKTFRSSPAVDLHGLRLIDLALWSAIYRRMPQRQTRGSLPLGFSGTRCQIHSGRCQRKTGLATQGSVGFELCPESQKPLRERGFGIGFGKHHLRFGLDGDRLVADDVPVGDIPFDQEWNQASHLDRFEGTDSGLRVRVSSQHACCEVVGHVGVRIRSDLSFRQGLHRLWQTPSHCGLRGFFRYSRQGQPAFRETSISSRGQNTGLAERSDRIFGAAQSEGKLSVSVVADSVFGCRAESLFGVLDQSHGTFRTDSRQTLQEALGDRVDFQVDQGQYADQALLWDKSQRGENADLDCCDHISAGSQPAQGAEIARKPAQNSADFEHSPVREDCFA
jgi:hypothetical protein